MARREPCWRVQVFRIDGTVRTEEMFMGESALAGHRAREFFQTVPLADGEVAEYQIRHAGQAQFGSFGFRPHPRNFCPACQMPKNSRGHRAKCERP